jgi:hypothetical protein
MKSNQIMELNRYNCRRKCITELTQYKKTSGETFPLPKHMSIFSGGK